MVSGSRCSISAVLDCVDELTLALQNVLMLLLFLIKKLCVCE